MAVFWVDALYSLTEIYGRFRDAFASIIRATIALIMEAASITETSVNFYQNTQIPRRQSSPDLNLFLFEMDFR
jgi:hypothetical protein